MLHSALIITIKRSIKTRRNLTQRNLSSFIDNNYLETRELFEDEFFLSVTVDNPSASKKSWDK
jgi:hypothetical protein